MVPLTIRLEKPTDIVRIHALESAAFGRHVEADIVDRLREAGVLWLSQVALIGDEIVGHAAYSMVSISDGERTHSFPALGPIAVAPSWQMRGIGRALIEAGMQAVQDGGFGLIFLVGHTSYYPRFGFQPALPLGFSSDYVKDGGRHEHFMVRVLDERLLGTVRGRVRYHDAFASH